MRYAPPGMCLNDFDVRTVDGGFEVTHLQGPWTPRFRHVEMETSYGTAFSKDLVDWRPTGPSFGVGAPGRFDDTAVWTMHSFSTDDGAALAYTGVRDLGWPDQTVGIARASDGPTRWVNEHVEATVTADPRWYRTGPEVAWRDPFVVRDDEGDGWVMVVCASDAGVPLEQSGCVGWAHSTDLENWEVHPPLISPGWINELECPALERDGDGWILLGCVGSQGRVDTWRAPRLRGPWTYAGPLSPTGAYAARLVTGGDGRRLLLHTTPRRVGLTDEGDLCRGMLAQPKVFDPSGARPRLLWWDGVDDYVADEELWEPTLSSLVDVDDWADDRVTVVLREDGEGGRLHVALHGSELSLIGCDDGVLRTTALDRPPTRLRILTVGEYVEVFADDEFVLMGLSYSGRPVVPWSDQGAVRGRPLRIPSSTRHDASAPWRSA